MGASPGRSLTPPGPTSKFNRIISDRAGSSWSPLARLAARLTRARLRAHRSWRRRLCGSGWSTMMSGSSLRSSSRARSRARSSRGSG
eukprot:4319675-Pyramimonas_sp.AAC.1